MRTVCYFILAHGADVSHFLGICFVFQGRPDIYLQNRVDENDCAWRDAQRNHRKTRALTRHFSRFFPAVISTPNTRPAGEQTLSTGHVSRHFFQAALVNKRYTFLNTKLKPRCKIIFFPTYRSSIEKNFKICLL